MNAQLAFDVFATVPLDPPKARAQRRANVARNIEHGLISETPAARNTDPETSHKAVEAILESGLRATNQQKVLEAVRRLPGLTYVELAKQCGLEKHEVMKRLNDLKGGIVMLKSGSIERPRLVVKGEARSYFDGRQTRSCVTWWPA